MSTPAGRYSRRVTINARTAGVDAYGQPVSTWSLHAQVWANCKPPTGAANGAQVAADRQVAPAAYSYRVRWPSTITPGMQLVDGDLVFSVANVLPDLQQRQHVDLVCLLDMAEVQ